jgi:dTDP-4-amino-4,6-dideoxygalactose transaminase
MKNIYYNKQFLNQSDFKEVKKALKENLITTGPYVDKLESSLQKYLKTKNAITCSSGTSAIFLALKSLELKNGDSIIMPSINFIASTNIAEMLGLKVYLADVDSFTGQMTPQTLKDCIDYNKLTNVQAVVTMYLGGNPNNIYEFYKLKKKLNFFLIEDSCHALGAKYFLKKKSFMVGCAKHCDISTFSMHPVKSITSGEGGIVTTNNFKIANKIRLLRSHGINRKSKFSNKNHYWKYDIVSPSLNFRLSDINAALAYSQLKKLSEFVKRRHQLYLRYKKEFSDMQNIIKIVTVKKGSISAHHLLIIVIDFSRLSINKDTLIEYINKKKIFPQYHYIPIYKFSYYKKLKKKSNFKNSETYYQNALSLPLYYKLKIKDLMQITISIKKILKDNEL